MKAKEFRDLTTQELETKVLSLKEELFKSSLSDGYKPVG